MADALTKGRFDPLLDWFGAGVPSACAGYAAFQLAPLFGQSPFVGAIGVAAALFVIAFAIMHSIKPRAISFDLPVAVNAGLEAGDLVLDEVWGDVSGEIGELLLDRPAIETRSAELAELLLDDALGTPDPDSRVVQLFAPGQLRERIDRHLANARNQHCVTPVDASDALTEALAELRQSLHHA